MSVTLLLFRSCAKSTDQKILHPGAKRPLKPDDIPEIQQTADAIDAAIEGNEDEAELLREIAGQYESLPGGYGIAVALRGIVSEVGLHAQSMRDQFQALRAACSQEAEGSPSRH